MCETGLHKHTEAQAWALDKHKKMENVPFLYAYACVYAYVTQVYT